jgi:hypothetical protein
VLQHSAHERTEVFFEFSDHMPEMKGHGLLAHFVALQARRIPLVRQCHQTPGFADSGGFWKTVCGWGSAHG